MSATQVLQDGMNRVPSEWVDNSRDFEYRPLPALVSVAGAFALFSLTAFVMDWLLLVPLIGILLCLLAIWQIRRSQGGYGGSVAAWSLLVVMLFELVGAASLYGYSYATEVPEGFVRKSFANDISKYELKTVNGQVQIPDEVQQLHDQPVFLKGYMYPEREMTGKTRFVLCKDMGQCCFGGNPKTTDMIVVEMDGHKTVDIMTGLVSVAGIFQTNADVGAAGLNPVYKLKCSMFSNAKTVY